MKKKTFQILQILSESMPNYEATTWLGTPLKSFQGRTPYDLIKLGQAERVHAEAQKHIKQLRKKKKPRSSK
jgi:uncharacterized protein (DUF2384 family)